MKFLVVGSNGFIGSSFLAHALEQGHECIAVSRSDPPHVAFLPHRWSGAHVPFWRIDLNEDLAGGPSVLADVLFREQPTHVVNCAALSMVAESWDHPDQWLTTNVVTLSRLIELLRRQDCLERFVHISTPEIFGTTDGLAAEDAPCRPSTPYAVSRLSAEALLSVYYEQYGFPVISVRPANVYGGGQKLYRIIPRTILGTTNGRKLPLHGGGHSERSFLHASDCSEGILRAALCGAPGSVYHISGYETVSIRALVQAILDRLGRRFEDCVDDNTADRLGKDKAYRLDSRKARIDLGWRDRISLHDGINDTIQWTRRYADVLKDAPLDYEHKP